MVEGPPGNVGDMHSVPGQGRVHKPRSSWAHAHMPQLLSLCSKAWELQLLKPVHPGACAQARQLASSPCSPKLEKSPRSNEDPVQPKIKKERNYFKK